VPETISGTRQLLTSHVARFRAEGSDAEPVIFGDRRQPEAALISYEMFRSLLDLAEDVGIARRLRERLAAGAGERIDLVDLAGQLDVDLDGL